MIKNAFQYLNDNISVIPIGNAKKALFSWAAFQKEAMSGPEAKRQFAHPKCTGIACITGAVSGNLEVIDIDLKYDISGNLYQRLSDMLKDILPILYTVRTPSGGYHLYYRCECIEGNQKLASRPTTAEERKANPNEKQVVLIETRGEGGYVVAPPTAGYTIINNCEIPVITVDQREQILAICREFNEVYKDIVLPQSIRTEAQSFGKTPWDDYNDRGDVIALLERHGWKIVGQKNDRTIFKRPGKTDSKSSGDFHHGLNLFKVFTTSSVFETDKAYSRFAVYTTLEHNGNFSEAAKQLLKDGFGEKVKRYDNKLLQKVATSFDGGLTKEAIVEDLVQNQKKSIAEATKIVDDILDQNGDVVNTFWEVFETKQGKKIDLLLNKFNNYLFDNGFHLFFYDSVSGIYRIVHQYEGFAYEATTEYIKKYVKKYIYSLPDKFDGINADQLLEVIMRSKNLLSDFEWLESREIDLLKDNEKEAFLPFKNGIVKITKDGAKLCTYGDFGKVVWKSHVIDFDITVDNDFDFALCEFYQFVNKVCNEDMEKLQYLCSLMGYLLHQYKDPSKPFAVVFAEETEDEKKGGGTGKGILVKALSYLTRLVRVDGKNFKVGETFSNQRVGLDTKLVAYEDMRKNVDFEGYYPTITEGMTIEKKNKDQLFIEYKDSPKILFTTNYTIPSTGNHAKRRQKVFEFGNFFSATNTPLDFFGHKLFDDWDSGEWNRFYNMMFTCIAAYLANGVMEVKNSNTLNRKHIKLNFGEELLSFWDDLIDNPFDIIEPFNKLYTDFLNVNDLEKKEYSSKRFSKALEECCEKFGYVFEKKRNGQSRQLTVYIKSKNHS